MPFIQVGRALLVSSKNHVHFIMHMEHFRLMFVKETIAISPRKQFVPRSARPLMCVDRRLISFHSVIYLFPFFYNPFRTSPGAHISEF